MKTSRIARETAKVAGAISKTDHSQQRQTRAFTSSLQTFAANDLSLKAIELTSSTHRACDSTSPASSDISRDGSDIEDLPFDSQSTLKRKRGHHSPATTISTAISTRASPRKVAVNSGNEAGGRVRKVKRQPAKRIAGKDGNLKFEAPADWEDIYNAVKEMRKDRLAPVDTMGCETLAEPHLSAVDKRFQTLIALMLSSQTKDTTNAIAMRRLQNELPAPGLTLDNILNVEPAKLNEMIFVVGFHNNKTRYIKAAAQILHDEYKGDIPDTIDGLMGLPGVGPKMAYLCMSAAWGRTEGIGVDVHVHRITNLWGWHKTKNPEDTRLTLQDWLPREKWHEINHLLVGFGQTICTPVGRKCEECTLSQRALCPSAVVKKQSSVKRSRKATVKGEASLMEVEVENSLQIKEEDVLAQDLP